MEWGFFTPIIVTYAYICFSSRSSSPYGTPSQLARMLPYHAIAGV